MSELENMKLWNTVCETNPEHTKSLNFGRKITAIDPYEQIKRATEVFGPVGVRWGWIIENVIFLPTNEVSVQVRLWHSEKPDLGVPQFGQASLYSDKAENNKDKDCMKKAVTDGVTKCLSFIGFNADVFLGKFDDNKYVQDMKQKHAEKKPANDPQGKQEPLKGPLQRTALAQQVRNYQSKFMKAETLGEFLKTTDDYKVVTDQAKAEMPELLTHSPEQGSPTLSHLYLEKKGELELLDQQMKDMEPRA